MKALAAKLQTISAINITPINDHLEVDYEALGENLDYLVGHDMEVIVPCGNTGEFYSLTIEEIRQIIAFASDRLRDRALVVAGIGHDLETAIGMARYAEEMGCQAVMIHHPPHPFISGPGYFEYVRRIAAEVNIGVIPYVKAVGVPDEVILDLARIDNVVGMKYALNDVQRLGGLVASTPPEAKICWICGTAESWAPFFFAAGATGFTSGLVNVAPDKSRALLDALRTNDSCAVRTVWTAIKPFEDLRARNQSEHNVSVVKEAMAQLGLGSRRVRPPISELTEDERRQVGYILESWK